MENDDSISDDETKALISEVYAELWFEVSHGGSRYFETSLSFTVNGSASYDEPDGHMATIKVVRVLDDGGEIPLRELQPGEEPYHRGVDGDAVAYTHVDDQIYFYPNPSSGTYKMYYRYQPTDLSTYADSQAVDVFSGSGEAFLIWGVAVLMLSKGEKDVRTAMDARERARERLQMDTAQKSTEPRSVFVDPEDDDGAIRVPTWDRP
jgi:hypothetical protein